MSPSRRVDGPHGSKRRLYPTGHLSEQRLKVGHSLLVNYDPPSLIVGVAVAEHENVLHDRLRQKGRLLRTHIRA